MHLSRLLPTLIAAATVTAMVPSPAVAAAPDPHEHYDDVFDILVPTPEDPPGSTFCGLLNVPVHGELHGVFSQQVRANNPYPYFGDRFRTHFVYTNPTTGKTFTVDTNGNSKDLRIVDNGDRTLTITGMFAGTQKVYGPSGELLLTDHGSQRVVVLVDTLGTVDPEDDQFLGLVEEPTYHGQHDTADRDFCEDFLLFTS